MVRVRREPLTAFVVFALALTVLRIVGLVTADANLGPDEAQYWLWSTAPAFGYFSKPPLIAWAISATTALFGDAEWAVRLSAPFFHLGTSTFLFLAVRQIYGACAGFWTGAAWLTLPGAALSSAIIATDAPLLFFWSIALYAYIRLLAAPDGTGSYGSALLLGGAIGFGMLAKYAMIYFPAAMALALALSPKARATFRLAHTAIIAVVALALMVPNILWNAQNDFQTLSHTAANANWGENLFHPMELLEFLASQFGVFGPILMALFVWGLARLPERLASADDKRGFDLALLAFALTPLAIVSVQALLSRAHANWAAASYPAVLILTTVWTMRMNLSRLLAASAVLHTGVAIVLLVAFSNFALIDGVGLGSSVKRLRAWPEQGAFVREAASDYDVIIVDDRELMGAMVYYARGDKPVRSWDSNNRIDNHYEAFIPWDSETTPHALFVALDPKGMAVQRRYLNARPVGEMSVDVKGDKPRTLFLFDVTRLPQASN